MNISLGRPMNVSNVQSNLNPVSREGGGRDELWTIKFEQGSLRIKISVKSLSKNETITIYISQIWDAKSIDINWLVFTISKFHSPFKKIQR